MKKCLKPTLSLLFLTALLILPFFVFAQTPPAGVSPTLNKLTEVAGSGGYSANTSLPAIIGLVIRAALGLVGVIFIILMIVAGFSWMTASGNEQKIQKAQEMIKTTIVGLIITVSAWALWNFILEKLIIGL